MSVARIITWALIAASYALSIWLIVLIRRDRKRRQQQLDAIARPRIGEITFPPNTIVAECSCEACGWKIHPTGWYFDVREDRKPQLVDLLDLWQGIHDDDGTCRERITVVEDQEDT